MLNYVEYLVEQIGLPASVCIILIFSLLVMNFVGEVLEFKGKIVPEYVKFRKYFTRKRIERDDTTQTLREVKQLLADVNSHYSVDNIAKRDSWMCWVNDRAELYDQSIVEISDKLNSATEALRDNTKMTEEMFIELSRDRIIDFAARAGDDAAVISMEEFDRIFKVYDKYEMFLASRGLTNGQIDVVYRVIKDGYEYRVKHHCFLEDKRGYK